MNQGAFEWALAENEVGPHTFSVRAIDFEGNVGAPTTFTWELLGVNVVFTDGPGFTPATGGPQGDPATGGPTASTSAEITFEANVGDVQFWCRFDSLDPGDYFPCESPFRVGPAFAGDTAFPDAAAAGRPRPRGLRRVRDDRLCRRARARGLRVGGRRPRRHPAAEHHHRARPGRGRPELDGLRVQRHRRPDAGVPAHVRVPGHERHRARRTATSGSTCTSPFNLLDVYSYADPQMLLTEHTFYVRAVDMSEPEFPDPTQPEFEGNADPTPASYTWTPVADTRAPVVTLTGGPADGATVGQEVEPYTFSGHDNATPQLRLEFECAAFLTAAGIGSAEWASCESPVGGGYDISGLEPGAYTVAVRTTDLAGNIGPAATRTVTVSAAPVVTFLSGPDGRLDPISGEPDGASGTENAVFTFETDQPGSTFECSVDGSDFLPCGGTTTPATGAAWVVENGTHEFAVRATNPQGIVGEETVYEWLVQLGADTTEPSSQFVTGPENGTLLQEATFTFSGTDNRTPAADLTFECALDSTTSWNSCTSPEQFSDLTRGSHTLRLRAVDAAGNVESTPAEYTWIVAPPPVATILSGPGVEQEETTDRTVTFTFAADVSPVTFHCWLDGKFNPHAPGDPTQPAPVRPGRPDLHRPRHRRPPVRRARGRPVREPRRVGGLRVPGHPVRGADHVGPGERDDHDGDVRVHERAARPRRGLLLLARRPPVRALRVAEDVHEPLPRRAHVPGADALHRRRLDGPAVRARPDPGRAHLDGPGLHGARDHDRLRAAGDDAEHQRLPPGQLGRPDGDDRVHADRPDRHRAGRVRARRRDRAHRPGPGRATRSPRWPPTCPATSTRARPRTRGRSARPPARRTRPSATTSPSRSAT